MATLAEATKPRDTDAMIPVEIDKPAAGLPPIFHHPPLNAFLDSSLPPSLWLQPDALRNFYTPGVPQERVSPSSSTSSSTINAQSKTTAKKVTKTLPTSGIVTKTNPLSPSLTNLIPSTQTTTLPSASGPSSLTGTGLDQNKIGQFSNSNTKGPVLDFASQSITMRGSVPQATAIGFVYTSTTTSIQWFWNTLAPFRTDMSIGSPQTSNQNITGLRTGVTYFFYPFWDETTGLIRFVDNTMVSAPYITGVSLNGTTGEITTTTQFTSSTTLSTECWFKTTAASAQSLVAHATPQTGAPASNAFDLYLDAAGKLNLTTSIGTLTSTAAYNDGKWHQAVAVISASVSVFQTLYIDTVSVANNPGSTITTANDWIRIGRGFTAGFFNGAISHVAFWNGVALNQNQIANHYAPFLNFNQKQYESAVIADAPTYFWKLIETSGTTAADSADSNTGTYAGGFTLNQASAIFAPEGTPAWAWPLQAALILQAQFNQTRLPLASGSMSAATPASGNGGGGGGGGSGGGGGGGKGLR